MKKLLTILISLFFYFIFLASPCIAQTISINVTEEVVGTVTEFTWGANVNNYSPNDYVRTDGIPKTGVTLLVMDMLMHTVFEDNQGQTPDFSLVDNWIATAKTKDLPVSIYIAYTPVWLARNETPYNASDPSQHNPEYDPPKNFTRYMELVEVAVNHVKDDVNYYEIWGEPNLPQTYPHWNGTEVEYREFLVLASQTIRRVDPDAVILAPSLSGVEPQWFERDKVIPYIKEVCVNASDSFDIFSFHHYSFPPDNWPSSMDNFTQELSKYGCGDKPLWMTESGIWKNQITWDYRDVLEKVKGIKVFLDYNVQVQTHWPFRHLQSGGTWRGLYNSSDQTLSQLGKYYQRATSLKLYGNRLNINSNIQDNISTISFLAIKNADNKIVLQLTNNYPTSQQVQINLPNIKNITLYESSADNDLDSSLYSVINSQLNLTLKPYSVYLINTEHLGPSGQLRNSTHMINANISIYNSGTNIINASQITSNGNYALGIWPGIYDLQFNILNFFIQNFRIELMSLNIISDLQNVVNYVNGYTSENKVSFIVKIDEDQEIQVYSEQEPKSIKVNGTEMTKLLSKSGLATNKWFYNSSEKKLYLITPPLECTDGTPYGQCSSNKPLYCDNDNLVNNCSYCECPSDYICNSTTENCNPIPQLIFFEDGFESGNLGNWTEIGTPTVVSTQKYNGTYSFEGDASGDFIYTNFSGQTTVYARGYFRFSALPTTGGQVRFFKLYYGSGGWGTATIAQLILEWTGSYGLTLHLVTDDSTYSYPISMSNSTWYPFEIKFVKHATNGEYRVWFNGNEVITITNLDTSGYGDVAKIAVGNEYSSFTTTVWTDSVKVSNKYI